MTSPQSLFETETQDDIVVIRATGDLSEFAYPLLETAATDVISLVEESPGRSLVVDLSRSTYCASTALWLFLKLWKTVRAGDGQMAFCGLSEIEKEVFATMKLDTIWPIVETFDEAVASIQN